MLERGRYRVGFPAAKADAFASWVGSHQGDVAIWSHATLFSDPNPRCVVRFEVHSPVQWGPLPAPECLLD